MIEKIARAIADSDGETVDGWDGLYQDRARAALEAMLEPSEGMIDAGLYQGVRNMPLRYQWQAMIRHALENEK